MTSSRAEVSNPEQSILFESLVLCDDIRHENNGKLLFVGVYSDLVQVAKLPLQMRSLGLAVKAKVFSTGKMTFSVSVGDPNGNTLIDANGELNYDGEVGHVIWLPIVVGPALLPTEGVYTVRIALGDNAPIHEKFFVRKAQATPEVRVSASGPN
jgi:hypothetical protein